MGLGVCAHARAAHPLARLASLYVERFGERPVVAISSDDVDAYKEALLEEGRLSNRTIVRHLVVMSAIFKRAKQKHWVTDNPASAEMVKRPSVKYSGKFDACNQDEVELLCVHAMNPQDAAIIRTAAYTGLRQGEVLALRWREVDFVTGNVRVERNYTDRTLKLPKGEKVGSVPMVPEVVDSLARLKESRGDLLTDPDDLVFISPRGGFVDNWSLRKRYYVAIKAAGLRRIRFHDLRHTFGTMAIGQVNPHTVQKWMRHTHFSTTERYLHHRPRPEEAQQLAQAFASSRAPVSGHARDTEGAAAPAPESVDAAFPLQS